MVIITLIICTFLADDDDGQHKGPQTGTANVLLVAVPHVIIGRFNQ